MSDIRFAISQLGEPEKSIGNILIEFYQIMKNLEKDPERGGKQATKIVMSINEIKDLIYGFNQPK